MKRKNKMRMITVILSVVMITTLLSGCGATKKKEAENTITVYLWSTALYNQYAPYIQSQLPDLNIQFIVGQNDLDFYKFMNENGELPDIIMSRRFSRHDAVDLKDQLMDLSATEEAGAIYESYLREFTNADGTINWLPICGTGDGIVANKEVFDKYKVPLPTDYDSFVSACQTFEKAGIRGFVADFSYDYTCMEILQGASIPEITSMEGSMWRSSYEDPDGEEIGLDDQVWPVVFENMERFIKDVNLQPEDAEMDYDPPINMFTEGKAAMIRAGSTNTVWFNNDGIEAVFLPYFGQNGEQWMLTYPEFQVAMNKDLENDSVRKEKALQVLSVMLSEGAQNVLSNNQDVITYNKNVNLELSPCLENLKPLIEQNHLFIRVASNDFFAISKDVVTKMIQGEYDAKQAYEAFDSQLREPKDNQNETILSLEQGYSNIFYTKGGSESYSVMANTVKDIYGSDILIAPGFSFTGSVIAADYTEKQVTSMIMPNGLSAFNGEMTGQQLKECIRDYVEGIEDVEEAFKPFNRGSLPIVSGITIKVQEQDDSYTLLDVQKDGNVINDDDTFKVTCLYTDAYIAPLLEKEGLALEKAENQVKDDLVTYVKDGGSLAQPESYITLREVSH
ncbi:MAG: extracellular solute-binding protein [Lachnospiraceae bacterium]